jgi:hypothetical protein
LSWLILQIDFHASCCHASVAFPLFSLFFPKFTARDLPFLAEILGFRHFGEQKNSEKRRCFSLFPAVFARRESVTLAPQTQIQRHVRRGPRSCEDIIASMFCQLNNVPQP